LSADGIRPRSLAVPMPTDDAQDCHDTGPRRALVCVGKVIP
jgi:hypothetical protein